MKKRGERELTENYKTARARRRLILKFPKSAGATVAPAGGETDSEAILVGESDVARRIGPSHNIRLTRYILHQ